MNFDVVIVGAGPSGLTMGIRLAQLAQQQERELTVCILEKGAEVGAHILSGAVVEPRTLSELIPDWKEKGAPLNVPVKSDSFKFLTENGSISMPTPPQMHNEGNYIISLGNLCRWLAEQAEELGVEIFPGFAAAEVLYDDSGAVRGVATGDMGIGKDGEPTDKDDTKDGEEKPDESTADDKAPAETELIPPAIPRPEPVSAAGERARVADPVERYLAEIRRYPILDRETERTLTENYVETGNHEAHAAT